MEMSGRLGEKGKHVIFVHFVINFQTQKLINEWPSTLVEKENFTGGSINFLRNTRSDQSILWDVGEPR